MVGYEYLLAYKERICSPSPSTSQGWWRGWWQAASGAQVRMRADRFPKRIPNAQHLALDEVMT